jgi:hypothetical protein
MGRSTTTKQDKASSNRQKKEVTNTKQDKTSCKGQRKKKPSKIVNASQLHVDRHQEDSIHHVDIQHQQFNSKVHTIIEIGPLESSCIRKS